MASPDPRDDKWGGPDIRISEYGLWDEDDPDDNDQDVPQTSPAIDGYSRSERST